MSRASRVAKLEQVRANAQDAVTGIIRAVFVRNSETGQPVYTGRAYVFDCATGERRVEERPELAGDPATGGLCDAA